MTRQSLNRTIVCCLLVVAMLAGASADTIFFDDFSDGSVTNDVPVSRDGVPVRWTPRPESPGNLDASTGDFVLTRTAESGTFISADVVDVILEDTSIRSRVSASGIDGSVTLTARNQDVADSQNYLGGIGYYPGEGGTILFLGRNNPEGAGPTTFFGDFPALPFDVRYEDAMLQFDVIGNELKLWGWRAGDAMPDQPQLVAIDDNYDSGFVRLFGQTTNNSISAFRFVHVADSHILQRQDSFALSPRSIYTILDADFDGLGDNSINSLQLNSTAIGEVDTTSSDSLTRVVTKFELPDVAADLQSATLRFFLETIEGTPAGPISLFHNVADNELEQTVSDYEDDAYVDTLLDLVQPTDEGQQYYELDVTDLVLADYASDGDSPLSAFRLQVTEAIFVDDGQSHNYRFSMQGSTTNRPELTLTFVPEPSTFIVAVAGLLPLVLSGRRRGL